MEPPTEHTIGRYQVIRRLGEGGMGTVYLARDPEIGRDVALKVLRVDNPEYRRRFKIEVTAAGSLRNRHIVTIFDSGVHEGLPFLAMEFLPGETLADKIARQEALPLDLKLRYAQELCEGLAHAHKAGVIHRDIKPANIAIDRDENSVKILDFGIARAVDVNTTGSGVMVGTLTYMSPEQVSGRPIDHRTDIFSAGLVLYELLSYRQAFPGGPEDGVPYRIVHDEPPRLETLLPALDRRVIAIVDRALKKDPIERYADAASMATDLRLAREQLDLSESTSAVTTLESGGGTTPSQARRVVLVAFAVSLLIAAAVALNNARRDRDVSSGSAGNTASAPAEPTRETLPPAPDVPAPQQPAPPLPQPTPQSSPSGGSPPTDVDPRRAERVRVVTNAEQLYAAGDGQRALDAVETASRTYPRDPDLERLLRRLNDDAERRVDLAEARASGALGDKASQSTAFRRGLDRRAETKSESNIASRIRTLWAAADLFDVAASEQPAEDIIASAPARSPDPQPQSPPANPSAVAEPPRATPAAEPPRMAAAPPSTDEERATIERTLNEYRSAYEALDVRRVLRVYPSLPNADALARAFADAREVRIGFSRPTIVLTAANTATATFNRTQEIVPKVGRAAPVDKRTLTLELRKDPLGVWLITAIK